MFHCKFWSRTPPIKESPGTPNDKLSYDELFLGIWRVLVVKDSRPSMFNLHWNDVSSSFPLLRRALYDVYAISPRMFALLIMTELWSAIEGPLSLYFSNSLFFLIEERISAGPAADQISSDLYMAMVYRIACTVLSAYMGWLSRHNKHAYSSRIKYEYEARVFSGEPESSSIWRHVTIPATLALDLPTTQDRATSIFDVEDIYRCLEWGIKMVKDAISFILHLRLFAHVIGTGLNDGESLFLALSMLPFLLGHLMSSGFEMKAYLVNATNKFYIRKSALTLFVGGSLKQEVIAGGINTLLLNEYGKAKDGLGDTPDIAPEWLYEQQHEALLDAVMTLCSDGLPLYFTFLAVTNPSRLSSMTQFAVLRDASNSLCYTFSSLGWHIDLWSSHFSRMSNVYAVLDTENKIKDGKTSFPRPGYEASAGMGIEVRDVSFSYPNSKSERQSLSSISFTIQPGQLVVVVGCNGSGKSTIFKLLSRLYEPTSGSIVIDGIPIEEYNMEDLRKGIAMLAQEHQLFPLSVEENIKLGSPVAEEADDRRKIEEAVLAAGAQAIVKDFSDGYDTVLEPVMFNYLSYAGQGNKELEAVQKELEKPTNVSGGERQKLVAARTFMRLFNPSIKLVTVDEPTAALDPEAEYQLFTRLREERNGRTMIFVTHRFGHLTKYADLIICIKEGAIVETGTHSDLLSKGGEYARLYNVQAQAFTTV